jgi:hypothetical protein
VPVVCLPMGKIEVLRLLDLYLKRIGSGTFNLVSKEVVTEPCRQCFIAFSLSVHFEKIAYMLCCTSELPLDFR